MAKYSYEFKMQIVQEYLQGKAGTKSLAKEYGMPSDRPLRRWIKKYQSLGAESLMRSRKNIPYPFEFKMHVVQLYLTTEVSYEDLAIQTGVKDAAIIARWVRDYRVAGIEALRPKPKGRRRNVDKKKISKELAKELPDEKAEYLKQLEDENLRLRLENAFLKELRRLRLEEEAQRTQRELQAVSEENSD